MKPIEDIIQQWNLGFIEKYSDTELCEIYRRNGSDKKTDARHNYTNLYYPIFSRIRNSQFNFFEVGIGTHNTNILSAMGDEWTIGGSLYAAAEFFPHANIFGADIDREILFSTPRIQTFFCDQTKAEVVRDLFDGQLGDKTFEVIIDDGLHRFDANLCFFQNAFHKLSPGGLFIIEDVDVNTLNSFLTQWDSIHKNFPIAYSAAVQTRLANLIFFQAK